MLGLRQFSFHSEWASSEFVWPGWVPPRAFLSPAHWIRTRLERGKWPLCLEITPLIITHQLAVAPITSDKNPGFEEVTLPIIAYWIILDTASSTAPPTITHQPPDIGGKKSRNKQLIKVLSLMTSSKLNRLFIKRSEDGFSFYLAQSLMIIF